MNSPVPLDLVQRSALRPKPFLAAFRTRRSHRLGDDLALVLAIVQDLNGRRLFNSLAPLGVLLVLVRQLGSKRTKGRQNDAVPVAASMAIDGQLDDQFIYHNPGNACQRDGMLGVHVYNTYSIRASQYPVLQNNGMSQQTPRHDTSHHPKMLTSPAPPRWRPCPCRGATSP